MRIPVCDGFWSHDFEKSEYEKECEETVEESKSVSQPYCSYIYNSVLYGAASEDIFVCEHCEAQSENLDTKKKKGNKGWKKFSKAQANRAVAGIGSA